VIDFMVMEAVALKVRQEDEAAAKDAKMKKWREDRENLKNQVQ